MKLKILILGCTGMLGQELVTLFSKENSYEVVTWSHNEVDVTNVVLLNNKVRKLNPVFIINATAYNAVDLCENNASEYIKALTLNRDVPESLGIISHEIGATFVHYSTDYVFGKNEKIEHGFTEDATPIPDCKYAMSKYLGEESVKATGGKFYIIRLSRLFGNTTSTSGKKSFFEIMLTIGKTKNEVQAVNDERSCFTYAPDLAQATKDLLDSKSDYGIYHLINEDSVTWHEGIVALYKKVGLPTKVVGVSGNTFTRNAQRPQFSVLSNTKRPLLRGYKEALEEYVQSLNQKQK